MWERVVEEDQPDELQHPVQENRELPSVHCAMVHTGIQIVSWLPTQKNAGRLKNTTVSVSIVCERNTEYMIAYPKAAVTTVDRSTIQHFATKVNERQRGRIHTQNRKAHRPQMDTDTDVLSSSTENSCRYYFDTHGESRG
jgi:hypothetical protein